MRAIIGRKRAAKAWAWIVAPWVLSGCLSVAPPPQGHYRVEASFLNKTSCETVGDLVAERRGAIVRLTSGDDGRFAYFECGEDCRCDAVSIRAGGADAPLSFTSTRANGACVLTVHQHRTYVEGSNVVVETRSLRQVTGVGECQLATSEGFRPEEASCVSRQTVILSPLPAGRCLDPKGGVVARLGGIDPE
jgi:hypothetical protein